MDIIIDVENVIKKPEQNIEKIMIVKSKESILKDIILIQNLGNID